MIIEQTIRYLQSHYAESLNEIAIEEVRMGVHLTAVKLSDGSYGMAGTGSSSSYGRHDRDFGPFTPNRITGHSVVELLESEKKSVITDTLKVAVLNALSSSVALRNNYKITENCDPLDLVDLSGSKTITMVGAFRSYIKKISETNHRLYVLELNEDALEGAEQNWYVPAEKYGEVIPGSDILIITGLTLVNGTLDNLLQSVSPGTRVIVTGPSANIVPEVLFSHGVSIIGATRITDGESLMKLAAEGGTGFHLFRYCAKKICISNEIS
jgi:uncharacterized protein